MKLKLFKLMALCLCAVLLCGTLVSCGEDLSIEGKKWNFSVGVDKDGKVIYCTKGNSETYPSAKIVALSCKAENGILTITELATGEIHKGTYSFERAGKDFETYHVSFEGEAEDHGDHSHDAHEEGGHANISCVETPDGGKTYTMTLTIEETTLTFFAPFEK